LNPQKSAVDGGKMAAAKNLSIFLILTGKNSIPLPVKIKALN